jgi:hypothetical protein
MSATYYHYTVWVEDDDGGRVDPHDALDSPFLIEEGDSEEDEDTGESDDSEEADTGGDVGADGTTEEGETAAGDDSTEAEESADGDSDEAESDADGDSGEETGASGVEIPDEGFRLEADGKIYFFVFDRIFPDDDGGTTTKAFYGKGQRNRENRQYEMEVDGEREQLTDRFEDDDDAEEGTAAIPEDSAARMGVLYDENSIHLLIEQNSNAPGIRKTRLFLKKHLTDDDYEVTYTEKGRDFSSEPVTELLNAELEEVTLSFKHNPRQYVEDDDSDGGEGGDADSAEDGDGGGDDETAEATDSSDDDSDGEDDEEETGDGEGGTPDDGETRGEREAYTLNVDSHLVKSTPKGYRLSYTLSSERGDTETDPVRVVVADKLGIAPDELEDALTSPEIRSKFYKLKIESVDSHGRSLDINFTINEDGEKVEDLGDEFLSAELGKKLIDLIQRRVADEDDEESETDSDEDGDTEDSDGGAGDSDGGEDGGGDHDDAGGAGDAADDETEDSNPEGADE